MGLSAVKTPYDHSLSHFDTILVCDRQMDRRNLSMVTDVWSW